MSADFELVVLDCPKCGAPLAGDDEDLVFYCTACRSGFRVPEGEAGETPSQPESRSEPGSDRLVPVEVSFLASPAQPPDLHLPFWLLPAEVEILQRKGSGGMFRGLFRFFLSGRKESGSAPGEGTFAVPAFRTPLKRAVELGMRYTFESPEQGELPRERLTGGCQTVEDARRLAEFMLIASEARKSDTLEELRYRLDFGPPRLLGVPFVRRDDALWDVFFGLPV
jgi:hypothetical protein